MGTFVRLKKGPRLEIDDDITLIFDDFVHNTAFEITANGKVLTFPSPTKSLFDHAMLITNRGGGNNTLTADFTGSTSSVTLADGGSVIVFINETGTAGTYEWGCVGLGTAAGITVPVKCTGAEVNTGTNDAKFLTPKAVVDSAIAVTSDIPVLATGAEINTGTNNTKFVTPKAVADSDIAMLTDIPSSLAGFDWVRTSLTGGTAVDLDGIGYATLSDSETAIVIDGNNPAIAYIYVFDIDNAGAESSPTIIKPDDAGAGNGRWVLASIKTLSTGITDWAEAVQDTVGAFIQTGPNYGVTAAYDDAGGAVSITNDIAKWEVVTLAALTALPVAGLTNLDKACVRTTAYLTYFYHYVAAATDATSSPDKLRIDEYVANGNKGVWYMDTVYTTSAGVTDWAEAVADTAGAMWTGNTETGCSVAYQDGDNTIDIAVTYGTTSSTACEGNDARLPTAAQKLAMFDYYCTDLLGGTAGTDVDGIVTAGSATVGGETCIVFDGTDPNRTALMYVFEKTGVAAESSPDVIRPDDFATDGQGNWNLVVIDGASQAYGTEPAAVSSSTSGTAGTAETASRSDHGHDLSDHTHAATFGAQLTMPVAMSDYTAPSAWTPTLVWATATPAGMTITAQYMKVGKLVNWWLHIESADPAAAGGSLASIAFDVNTQPADVGAGNIQWPVTGFHRKDSAGADTWTDVQAWLNCTAAAAGDRLVTIKNPVVWADNEVTQLFLSGSHYTA